jgi:DNA (cytosine-5)-methyltransferase 1
MSTVDDEINQLRAVMAAAASAIEAACDSAGSLGTTEPHRTMTTRDRYALIDPDTIVDDCGFRMLEPYEVAAAMAFPAGYIPRDLAKKHQVKLAGNAVTPPVMTWIIGRVLQAMGAT